MSIRKLIAALTNWIQPWCQSTDWAGGIFFFCISTGNAWKVSWSALLIRLQVVMKLYSTQLPREWRGYMFLRHTIYYECRYFSVVMLSVLLWWTFRRSRNHEHYGLVNVKLARQAERPMFNSQRRACLLEISIFKIVLQPNPMVGRSECLVLSEMAD